jgi:hypothetical protein
LPFLASLPPFEPASVEEEEEVAAPAAAPLDEDDAPAAAADVDDVQSRLMDESMRSNFNGRRRKG